MKTIRDDEPMREWSSGSFRLVMWGTNRRDDRGQTVIAYTLHHDGQLIFEGMDFCGSPMHADDSDQTVSALLGFLALQPGETDREYFESYTPEQLEFAEMHGEELSLLAMELEEGFSEEEE